MLVMSKGYMLKISIFGKCINNRLKIQSCLLENKLVDKIDIILNSIDITDTFLIACEF